MAVTATGLGFRLREATTTVGLLRLAWLGPLSLVFTEYRAYVLRLDGSEILCNGGGRVAVETPEPLEKSDYDELWLVNPHWTREKIERRLAEGQQCFVWKRGGTIAHCRWMSYCETYLPYLGRRLRPTKHQVLSVEAYTRPEYRRQGLYRNSVCWGLENSRERGREEGVFIAAWWNQATRTALINLGAEEVGTLRSCLGLPRYSGRVRSLDRRTVEVR